MRAVPILFYIVLAIVGLLVGVSLLLTAAGGSVAAAIRRVISGEARATRKAEKEFERQMVGADGMIRSCSRGHEIPRADASCPECGGPAVSFRRVC